MSKRKETLAIEHALADQTREDRIYGCEEVTIGFANMGKGNERGEAIMLRHFLQVLFPVWSIISTILAILAGKGIVRIEIPIAVYIIGLLTCGILFVISKSYCVIERTDVSWKK